jgi:alpha-L-arabinofuranosidase
VISLFPEKTFKGRKNGLRPDLAQALADLHPKFLRFPGGCIVHGYGLAQAYRWKDSVGDVAKRRANHTTWGYHQTLGLGYFEYFQLCEDIGAAPLPVVPVGVSCGFNFYECADMDELDDWIQDAIDLIEFANGSADSKWGGLRARMGHPEPFGLKYICLGNEEHDTPQVRERFPLFVTALKKAHPEIKIIGTSGLGANTPLYDFMKELGVHSSDEHYYSDPEWFIKNQNRFDTVDRNGPKRFVGEYASNGNTLFNAIAEAAFLTGVERNGDIVEMTAYAPLLAHVDHIDWPKANMMYFDKHGLAKTPNYYVQQMFSCNKGDRYLSNRVISENKMALNIAVSATRDNSRKEIILKLVNYGGKDVDADIHLAGITHLDPQAEVTVLTGNPKAVNTLQNPDAIVPRKTAIQAGERFQYKIPAYSVQVIRVGMK